MNPKVLLSSMVVAGIVAFAGTSFAQAPKVEFPAPSPACTLKQRVGLTDFEIVYSRPSMKGRKIFGGLVAYGEVWRTGANNATKLTFNTPVKFNGHEIPAGTYGLFTIPGEKEWTIIINKNSGQWGAYRYDEKQDVVRFKVTPDKLAEQVETFTIDFNDLRDESATLYLVWDNVFVPIRIELDLTSKLVAQIEEVMASSEGSKPYFQSAMFYYNHDQDLDKALKWVDAAIAEREAFYIVHLKAKILAKKGDKQGAIAAANKSKQLAIEAKDSSYIQQNDDLIASLKN